MRQAALNKRKSPARFLYPLTAAVFISFLAACAVRPIPETDEPVVFDTFLWLGAIRFDEIPGWTNDRQSEALPVFLKSCEKLKTLPPGQKLKPKTEPRRVADWLSACAAAGRVRAGNEIEAQYFFESHFTPYRVRDNASGSSRGLFTGYYEPELLGAWRPDTTYRYPIYGRPKDLVSIDLGSFRPEWKGQKIAGRLADSKLTPYPTRADIDGGTLKGKQLELLWVDNAIDAFFLHIQGSGRVVFRDGSVTRIGYAGRNGRRYTPIGRELVARGILTQDKVSMQSIQSWLAANPHAGIELMQKNESYIFFRILKEDGPIGAQGVQLTPGRSLAVDRAFIPLGVPIWLRTTAPGRAKKPLRRLVIAQDTGSAIKGTIRGDLFVGYGAAAGVLAGQMKQKGTYYLLLPKKTAP